MKLRILPLFCLCSALLVPESPLRAATMVSYEDLPKLVRERNENVQAAQASVRAQERRAGSFTRSFLPGFTAELGSESHKAGPDPRVERGYWRLGAGMNLFRGGRDLLEGDRRAEALHAARAGSAGEYARELKEARLSYWKLVAVSQLIGQREEGLGRNEKSLKAARRRSGSGQAAASDALQFELHQTVLRQELKRLVLERDLLRNRLSVALGWDEHESIEVSGDFPLPGEGKLLPGALDSARNLDVVQLRSKEKEERLAAARIARWWAPSLDLYASYGTPALSEGYSLALRREQEWTAGLKLSMSLGEGIEARSEAAAKALDAASQERRVRHRIREVVAEDHELRHDIKLLHELIHDANRDSAKAEKFLLLTEQEYARGVKNGPDMLGALQRYYDFLQRRTELYRDFHLAGAELDALLAEGAD